MEISPEDIIVFRADFYVFLPHLLLADSSHKLFKIERFEVGYVLEIFGAEGFKGRG